MPNINEFINQPEKIYKAELERIGGTKPCSKCDKDSEEYFWDAVKMIMSWKCPDGHENSFEIN